MPLLIQRICQNREQWTRPSGYPKDEGYPKKQGFGWDEWNFCFSDSYDGYVYGHTPYRPSSASREKLGPEFCVAFWTKNPQTNSPLLVGFYDRAQWTTEAQSDAFETWMRKGGRTSIWSRRTQEIVEATRRKATEIKAEFAPGGHVWRLRCPVSDVRLVDTPLRLSPKLVSLNQRLSRPLIWRDGSHPTDLLRFCKPLGHSRAAKDTKRRLGYERSVAERTSMVDLIEEGLRERFVSFLSQQPRIYSRIETEVGRIDVTFFAEGRRQIAELKSFATAPSPHAALRHALAQLLSYNYGAGRSVADQWWIVVDEELSHGDWAFLRNVASKHDLPLTVAYPKRDDFIIENLT